MAISTEDHVAISRLMYRYARCADARDYEGFADVFCPDAQFDLRGELVSSLPDIQQMMHNLDTYSRTQHFVHNVLYDVEGEQAQGQTYCLACHLQQTPGGAVKIDMGITYDDILRRTPDGWRIARRLFNLLWSSTGEVESH